MHGHTITNHEEEEEEGEEEEEEEEGEEEEEEEEEEDMRVVSYVKPLFFFSSQTHKVHTRDTARAVS